MIKTRNQLLSKFKRSGEISDWNMYKQLRNIITAAVKKEKKAYYSKYINYSGNPKTTWTHLKKMGIVQQKNKVLSASLADVDRINEHFINSVPDLSPDDDLLSFYADRDNCSASCLFRFRTVDEIEVLESIKSIKSKAVGYDGINILTLHLCVPHILPHITHIVNYCLKKSVFPSQWKRAVVLPVPKVSNPRNLNNLRPISILPTLSKILEKDHVQTTLVTLEF
ncbi:uncharacterized protein LOC123320954 [Coccinella septempunctata]|uniref:uncharacterized protein LOC123320954 n=1 Tax=Coccinella septempunctata TaxID=41139 RepID=UPI001D065262|nr:uncharacterized protein LOC123320954 [Coccinella septempunctata]